MMGSWRSVKVSTTWDHRLPPANKSYAYNYNISLSRPSYTAPRGVSGGGGFKIYRDFPGSDNFISATASSLPVYGPGSRSGVRGGGGGDLAYVTCHGEKVEGDDNYGNDNRPSYPTSRQQRPCGPRRPRSAYSRNDGRDPRKKYTPHASLSEAEAELLKALDNENDTDTTTRHDANKDAKIRFELKKLIVQRRDLYLTAKEATFLDHLAMTPGVPIEALEKTANVLRKCPLYNDLPTDVDYHGSDNNSLADTVCADESDSNDGDESRGSHSSLNTPRSPHPNDDDIPPTNAILADDDTPTTIHRHVVRQSVVSPPSWCRQRRALSRMDHWRRSSRDYSDDDAPQMRSRGHGIAYLFCCPSDHATILPVTTMRDGEEGAAEVTTLDLLEEEDDDDVRSVESRIDFSILGTSAEDVASRPRVLSPPVMKVLRGEMPYMVQEDNYWMKYSLLRDGASMRILFQQVRSSLRTILAVETTDGEVFGAFVSSPWRYNGRNFYGSCESFLWRLRSSSRRGDNKGTNNLLQRFRDDADVDVFHWSPDNYTPNNRYIQLSNYDIIALGGDGDGFGLSLNGDLTEGTTAPCRTFDNPRLTTTKGKDGGDNKGTFTVANVEVWTMTPVDTVEQAEQLELARAFIVEHSEFGGG